MSNEFDTTNTLQKELALILALFSAIFIALALCSVKRRGREPTRKKTLELNE
jgi:lipopolysaccharide export LptBFGC system permease protein LptF